MYSRLGAWLPWRGPPARLTGDRACVVPDLSNSTLPNLRWQPMRKTPMLFRERPMPPHMGIPICSRYKLRVSAYPHRKLGVARNVRRVRNKRAPGSMRIRPAGRRDIAGAYAYPRPNFLTYRIPSAIPIWGDPETAPNDTGGNRRRMREKSVGLASKLRHAPALAPPPASEPTTCGRQQTDPRWRDSHRGDLAAAPL